MPLLNLTSIESAQNLIPPLRQIGLIDGEGKVTPRANDWRTDAKYLDACREMVNDVYPEELRDLFPGPEVDRQGCMTWFMHTAKLGQAAASQCTAMFTLLRRPLSESSNSADRKPSSESGFSNKTTKPGAQVASGTSSPAKLQFGDKEQRVTLPVQITLQLQITPETTEEQMDTLFASIARHLLSLQR